MTFAAYLACGILFAGKMGINHIPGKLSIPGDIFQAFYAASCIASFRRWCTVAESFEQAEKLKQKRIRYNEVMDILNPPKEEQNLDTDGGDAVQYQQRKNPQKDIREDISFPKNSREASGFIRSYANKTNGMKGKSTVGAER